MVDWSLARQVAELAGGGEMAAPLELDLDEAVARSERELTAYTGLSAPEGVPAPEPISRSEWAAANLDTLSSLLDPVGDRLEERMGFAGPLAGPLRAAAAATLATEVGLVIGYLSRRVLGQYELSLLQAEGPPPRLLLVTSNLDASASALGLDREPFVEWVVLHEVTHALQFAAVPWLRPHLGGLLEEYLATVEVRIERGAAGALPSMPDLDRIVEAFREGGLAALVQTREQRRVLDRVQAAMAIVEGYSEHTMDAVGARVLPDHERMRAAMERRRHDRSAPERILQRLLGLDMKLKQYEVGRAFCSEVVSSHGIERLNRVWSGPEALPSAEELTDPLSWADRAATLEPPATLPAHA